MYKESFEKTNTPDGLYGLLQVIQSDPCWGTMWQVEDRFADDARQAAIRIRRAILLDNPHLKIESVGQKTIPEIMDWCTSCKQVISQGEPTPTNTDNGNPATDEPPIKVEGRWSCESFTLLRKVDSDATRKGIPADDRQYHNAKDWLSRHRKRPDIAETLSHKNGLIKTILPPGQMFSEKS